ncbi:MAG: hypothetical protein WCJ30_11915 [Deltaproteobacteria bacterium]
MSDINNQIEQRIQIFVTELSGLVRQAALDAVQTALGGKARLEAPATTRGPGRPKKSAGRPAKPAAAAPKAPKAPKAAKGGTRGRRTPEQIEATIASVLGYIKAHPNTRSEAIRAALKLARPAMRDALDRLSDGKKIKMKGVKRAASYTAA